MRGRSETLSDDHIIKKQMTLKRRETYAKAHMSAESAENNVRLIVNGMDAPTAAHEGAENGTDSMSGSSFLTLPST